MSHRSLKLYAGLVRDFSGLVLGDEVEFKTLQTGGSAHAFIRIQEEYAKIDLLGRGLDCDILFVNNGRFLVWTFKIVRCKE